MWLFRTKEPAREGLDGIMHAINAFAFMMLYAVGLIAYQVFKGVFIVFWTRIAGVQSNTLGYTLAVIQVGLFALTVNDRHYTSLLWHNIGTAVLAFTLAAEVMSTLLWRAEKSPMGFSTIAPQAPPGLLEGRASTFVFGNPGKWRTALIGAYIASLVALIFATI